jgi:hypothetical protein
MNEHPFNYQIEYKNPESGHVFNYKTSSEFDVDRILSQIVNESEQKGFPLWKTKLKITKFRRDYLQCFITVNNMDKCLFSMKFHYN